MHAIIRLGGHQYRVEVGQEYDIELLEASEGTVCFDEVLLFSKGEQIVVGQPTVARCSVNAEIVDIVKGEKKITLKYEPRHGNRRIRGHRQKYTRVKITAINFAG